MAKKNINNTKSINDNQNDSNQDEVIDVRKKKFWKFWIVMFLLTVGMFVVIGRLVYIQIVNSSEYLEQAKKQQQTKQEITPQRGNIYDRNGNLLASTIKSISIAIDPTVLKNKDTLATLIEKNIGTSRDITLYRINSSAGQFLRLARRVTPDKVDEIRRLRDRGILLIDEPIRYYNYSSVAAQILGGTSIDNKGLGGVELRYDSLLRENLAI